MTWSKYTHNPDPGSIGPPTADRLLHWFPELSPQQASRFARMFSRASRPQEKGDVLQRFNEAIDAYGIEAIRGDYHVDNYYFDIVATYVNTGDTYNATVVLDSEEGDFEVTTMGDWVEKNQDRYNII